MEMIRVRELLAHEVPEETHNLFYKLDGKWYKRPMQMVLTDNIQPDPPTPTPPVAAALPPPTPTPELPDQPKQYYQWVECHVCQNWVKVQNEDRGCPQCSTRWRRACKYHSTRRSGCRHGEHCKFLHMDKFGTKYWNNPAWEASTVIIEEVTTEVPEDTVIHTSVTESPVRVRVVLDPNPPDISCNGVSIRGAFCAAIPLPHARHLKEKAPRFPVQLANLN